MGEVVAERLALDDPDLDADTRASRARLTTLVAFAAMRHAWQAWAHGEPHRELTDQLAASFDELKSLLASEHA